MKASHRAATVSGWTSGPQLPARCAHAPRFRSTLLQTGDRSVSAQATASRQPHLSAATQQPQLAAAGGATVLPDSGSQPSTVVVPKITTTTVSRGNSLWRLSQNSVRRGHALRRHLQSEQGTDPKSQPDLSRSGLCPSRAVKRGTGPDRFVRTDWKSWSSLPATNAKRLRKGAKRRSNPFSSAWRWIASLRSQ